MRKVGAKRLPNVSLTDYSLKPILMRISYASILSLNILFFVATQRTTACGYDWVGDCSSAVQLRINGTLDSFSIADCPSGIRFNSLYLGTIQSLSLANAKAINWESCFNNVTGVSLKYRVYEQGGGAGNFLNLNLDQDYFTVLGPYTTRYRSKASNIDLATGLVVGKTYTLEVYLVAEVDTIGDDFIPETTLTKNNNGQNYKLSFTYGGPAAAPFVVIPTTVKMPNCHGESNGTIAVSVWGDHFGLFYNWSNVSLNFFQQNGLSAGTYTVSVTSANYATSSTVVLGQPDALTAQIANIQPVACGGGQGAITVQANGGTPPYQYLWANGQTTATAVFPNSGNYAMSLTDAHNCIVVQSFNLPGGGTVQQNSSRGLCVGQSIVVGGVIINAPGIYTLNIPGNGGCDTLLTLTVNPVDPSVLLANMPSNILVTCNNPTINLCAEVSPTAFYQWSKDGIPATQTPCLLASAGGVYTLMVIQEGCTASKSIVSEEHLVEPLLSAFAALDYILDCYLVDSTAITFQATTNAIGPQFAWLLNGQIVSTAQSFTRYFDGPNFPSVNVVLTVTDQFGCDITKQPVILFSPPPMAPFVELFTFMPDLCNNLQTGNYYIWGSNDNYLVTWNDSVSIGNEIALAPGLYTVKIINDEGCVTEQVISVPPFFRAIVYDSPFPNSNTGSISIDQSSWLSMQWSNGSMSSSIYGLAPGEYCVTMTDQQDCTLDTCFTIKGSVSTFELQGSTIQISPNPVASGDWIDIQLSEKFWSAALKLQLTDSQGKKIWSENQENSRGILRFQVPENLPPGIFYLQVSSKNGQATGKVCLKK